MLAIDHSTRSAPRKATLLVTAVNGDRFGEYRKPHMIAAMTPGTAYGAKKASRKNFLPRSSGESSSSAKSRASPSMTGTCTTPNTSTRNTDAQNASFWKTATYWIRPPKTCLASPKVPSRSTVCRD